MLTQVPHALFYNYLYFTHVEVLVFSYDIAIALTSPIPAAVSTLQQVNKTLQILIRIIPTCVTPIKSCKAR